VRQFHILPLLPISQYQQSRNINKMHRRWFLRNRPHIQKIRFCLNYDIIWLSLLKRNLIPFTIVFKWELWKKRKVENGSMCIIFIIVCYVCWSSAYQFSRFPSHTQPQKKKNPKKKKFPNKFLLTKKSVEL
jgi:hypothetical protein